MLGLFAWQWFLVVGLLLTALGLYVLWRVHRGTLAAILPQSAFGKGAILFLSVLWIGQFGVAIQLCPMEVGRQRPGGSEVLGVGHVDHLGTLGLRRPRRWDNKSKRRDARPFRPCLATGKAVLVVMGLRTSVAPGAHGRRDGHSTVRRTSRGACGSAPILTGGCNCKRHKAKPAR